MVLQDVENSSPSLGMCVESLPTCVRSKMDERTTLELIPEAFIPLNWALLVYEDQSCVKDIHFSPKWPSFVTHVFSNKTA